MERKCLHKFKINSFQFSTLQPASSGDVAQFLGSNFKLKFLTIMLEFSHIPPPPPPQLDSHLCHPEDNVEIEYVQVNTNLR